MDFIITYLLPILIPAVLGAVVSPILQGLKRASDWLEAQKPWVKQLAVGVLSLVATLGAPVLGVPIPADILHMDGTVVTTILTALFAFLTHKLSRPVDPA